MGTTQAHLGYEGLSFIGTRPVLGTSASVARSQNRLVSSSGYGGSITNTGGQMAVGSPYTHDWPSYSGSMSFDVNDMILPYIIPWFYNDRNSFRRITLMPRTGNSIQQHNQCWWESFSLQTSESSFVEASLGFMSLDREVYNWGDESPSGGGGGSSTGQDVGGGTPPTDPPQPPLQPDEQLYPFGLQSEGNYAYWYQGMFNWLRWTVATEWNNAPLGSNPGGGGGYFADELMALKPIPYWNTGLAAADYNGGLSAWDVSSWNVSFSQPVEKFFTCHGSGGMQKPSFIGVGPMTVRVSGVWVGPREWAVAHSGLGERLLQMKLYIPYESGTFMEFNQLREDDESDPVRGQNEVTATDFSYEAFGINHSF